MKKLSTLMKDLWNDESGQGATEYILLLVVVVSLALIFRGRIEGAVKDRMQNITDSLSSFGVGGE